MSEQKSGSVRRRRKRVLSAEEKLQIYQQLLSGELSLRAAAERWDVDPTTIMRIRRVAREGALGALAQSRPGRRQDGEDAELAAARAEVERLSETVKGAGRRAGHAAGKTALGLVGPTGARVDVAVKQALLGLLEHATGHGWTQRRACRVLGLDERRARRWAARAAIGKLADRRPGGHALHGLTPGEITAILALADEWGAFDGSHRKLAHRGSYEQRVWVSPSTVLRVLLANGRVLPHRPAREPVAAREWPAWVQYRPNIVWGYDLTAFPAARTAALAIVDLVSRRWIDWLLCPEATSLQVQVLFTRALDAEGLLDAIVGRADRLADPAAPNADQPVLLAVSDNGPQMTSGSTREFMALHAIATHRGRPGVPTDQAHIESFFGHLKHDHPQLERLADPADLARELAAAQQSYNRVRLHAAIGYVTPDDEHQGRGPRSATAAGSGYAEPAKPASLTIDRPTNRPAHDRSPTLLDSRPQSGH